ncbi:MAG: superoxide dismutase [Alphaproteobacteria bacterium]
MTAPVQSSKTKAKPFTLPPLPYEENALEPVISAKTMGFHYGKHHKAYVDKLNELVGDSEYADMDIEEIVRATDDARTANEKKIFNNAAQVWNHSFFWSCLAKDGGKPSGELKGAIERDFESFDKLKQEFAAAAVELFGSGWAWLVLDDGVLKIAKTPDAETPMAKEKTCLLAIDVWEHAYYLDYQNRRPDYVKAVIDKLLNWDFAAENFAAG